MKNKISVREWQKNFTAGIYDDPSFDTQVEAGWYDWFCRDSSLVRKTQRMGKIIAQIKDGGKINLDSMYVWFKNNCPMEGRLYDDFRFADTGNGKTLMTITLRNGYNVYCEGHWSEPIIQFKDPRQLVKWLNKPEESAE